MTGIECCCGHQAPDMDSFIRHARECKVREEMLHACKHFVLSTDNLLRSPWGTYKRADSSSSGSDDKSGRS